MWQNCLNIEVLFYSLNIDVVVGLFTSKHSDILQSIYLFLLHFSFTMNNHSLQKKNNTFRPSIICNLYHCLPYLVQCTIMVALLSPVLQPVSLGFRQTMSFPTHVPCSCVPCTSKQAYLVSEPLLCKPKMLLLIMDSI